MISQSTLKDTFISERVGLCYLKEKRKVRYTSHREAEHETFSALYRDVRGSHVKHCTLNCKEATQTLSLLPCMCTVITVITVITVMLSQPLSC